MPGLIKAAVERGLQAELTSHVGYDKKAIRTRPLFEQHVTARRRRGADSKVGDVDLDAPGPAGLYVLPATGTGARRLVTSICVE